MKKILIVSLIGLSSLVVGCDNNSKLSSNEYVEKLTEKLENTIASAYSEGIILNSDDKYNEEYDNKDLADRERFKDFINGILDFKTNNENINKFNNKIIELSEEVYNMLNDLVNLDKYSEEYKNLKEKISLKKEEIAKLINELYKNLGIKINN